MAYKVIFQGDYAAPTIRDTEDVVCQIAEVSNRAGIVSNRMEARVQVNNPISGYVGMSKTALVFDSADAVDELIAQLTEMNAQWRTLKLGATQQEAPAKVKRNDQAVVARRAKKEAPARRKAA